MTAIDFPHELPNQEMIDPNFTVVFDIGKSGLPAIGFLVQGPFFIFIGLLLPRLMDSGISRRPAWFRYWFPKVWLTFAILFTTVSFISVGVHYLRDSEALTSGKAKYVEGPVENFVPMPYTGHAMESFSVKGVSFSYSDYVVTSGFNNTASHGGPIRNGLYVRIWYLGNEILKLEIRNP